MCDSSPKKGFKQVKTKTKNKKIKNKKKIRDYNPRPQHLPFCSFMLLLPMEEPPIATEAKTKTITTSPYSKPSCRR